MNVEPIRVLLVEDDSEDAVLFQAMLLREAKNEFRLARVSRISEALQRLQDQEYDIILSDLGLPDSQGSPTYWSLKRAAPNLPVVVLSGLEDEEFAVKAVKDGAQDYLVKSQVSGPLLVRSLRYAVERKRIERERDGLIRELEQAMARVRQLQGILPICSYCKSIRDDKNSWQQLEAYVKFHSEAVFSHGICPGCWENVVKPQFLKQGIRVPDACPS